MSTLYRVVRRNALRPLLSPGSSVYTYALAIGQMIKIRGWENTAILRVALPNADNECDVEWLDEHGQRHVNCVWPNEIRPTPLVQAHHFTHKIQKSSEGRLQKLRMNRVLRTLLKYLEHGVGSQAIVLDHYDLRTSTMLRRLGLASDHIFLPNPAPDFAQRAKHKGVATHSPQTLFQFIHTLDDEQALGPFLCLFDFCCTFRGGPLCQPTVDLHTMFRKTLLAKGRGVLWLTFSVRGMDGGAVAVLAEVEAWLQAEALIFNYTLTRAYTHTYGTVVTMLYVTGRDYVTNNFDFLKT